MDQQAQSIDKSRRSADIQKAELERRKRDLYKIYNPTNQDFQVILNAAISPEVWTVPAKDEAIVPLYVAEKYFEEMSQKIITAKSDKAIIEENEKRMQKGFNKMDFHTEQARFESRNLKILMGKQDQVVAVLNRGLYKEYGIGGNKEQVIDRRDSLQNFNPGIDLGDSPAPSPAPVQTAPTPDPIAEPIIEKPMEPAPVVEEEPDEVEEIKNGNE